MELWSDRSDGAGDWMDQMELWDGGLKRLIRWNFEMEDWMDQMELW